MAELIINGGRRLEGAVNINGAKNSVLPLLCATVLTNGRSVLHNCPDLSDVDAALDILNCLGIYTNKNGSDIEIIAGEPKRSAIPEELMLKMRSSVMFLGAILGRTGSALISAPGGCMLGPRPIDMHISALKKMGAKVTDTGGRLEFIAEDGLKGADITLAFPSVGATENVIMAAVLAKGTTTLYNAAREPEIKDLTDFLKKAGADISGGGTDTVVIRGASLLKCAEHTVIPDRIEAATYMSAAVITGGSITLNRVAPGHLLAVNEAFSEAGCSIECNGDTVKIEAPDRPKAVNGIMTRVYPGFPTDAGPLFISALSAGCGTSVLIESIFQNRFGFVDEIARFGANIKTYGAVAVVSGTDSLCGASCRCTDLRGGAALVVAALKAKGKSRIGNICHIKRGYQDIREKLSELGADIKEV